MSAVRRSFPILWCLVLLNAGILCASALADPSPQVTRSASESAAPADSSLLAPAPSLDSLKTLIRAGRYADAELGARARLASDEVTTGHSSIEVARALDLLGESLWRGGKSATPEAREVAERAITIHERLQGPEHVEVAKSLNNLGNVHRLNADYARARPVLERALAIRKKALGPDDIDVAGSMNNLAIVLNDTGDPLGARRLYESALVILEKKLGPDHPSVALVLTNIALARRIMGDYAGASPLLERSLAIRESRLGPDHPVVADTRINLGNLLEDTGDLVGAQAQFTRALAIVEKSLGPEHPELALVLNNLAASFEDAGDFAEAHRLLERALAIEEKAVGSEHPDYARSLVNLALVEQKRGDYAAARALGERGLAIFERAIGPEHAEVGRCLDYLAAIAREMGDDAQAQAWTRRAATVTEKALGPKHPSVALSLDNLAAVLRETGDLAGARAADERALAIARRSLEPSHPQIARLTRGYALTLLAQEDSSGALAQSLIAESIGRDHLRLTTRGLSERQALRYAEVRTGGLDVALAVVRSGGHPLQAREVWDALIRSRAVVLDEMAARHRGMLRAIGAPGGEDTGLDSLWSAVESARSRLANLTVRGLDGADLTEHLALLADAAREKEEAERALAGRSAPFEAELARTRIGFDEVAASIPPGTTLLAYSRYLPPSESGASSRERRAGAYLAFVARDSSRVETIDLGDAHAIDSLAALWREEAGRSLWQVDEAAAERAYRKVGEALRRRVWDPVASRIDPESAVIVVPDGALNLVNLAALPIGDQSYLVEQRLLHYVSAERDLVRDSIPPGVGLLAVGDPDCDRTGASVPMTTEPIDLYRGPRTSCAEIEAVRFPRLPGARREVQTVARLWERRRPDEPVVSLLGIDPREARVKAEMRGKRVIHLATHGFVFGDPCTANSPRENPLLLAGLALTGANLRQQVGPAADDGVLTAEEVASLDLRGVEWAVLSGCETGTGDLQAGEGVLGLRRAFRTAGVRTLILSLWPVEDRAGEEWMADLYSASLDLGMPTAEAVREASLRVLSERRRKGLHTHPSVWASFIAAGNPR